MRQWQAGTLCNSPTIKDLRHGHSLPFISKFSAGNNCVVFNSIQQQNCTRFFLHFRFSHGSIVQLNRISKLLLKGLKRLLVWTAHRHLKGAFVEWSEQNEWGAQHKESYQLLGAWDQRNEEGKWFAFQSLFQMNRFPLQTSPYHSFSLWACSTHSFNKSPLSFFSAPFSCTSLSFKKSFRLTH